MKKPYYIKGFTYLLGYFFLLGLATTACQMEKSDVKPSFSVVKVHGQEQLLFSGQALYRGIFFTQGQVAEKIPTLTSQMPHIADFARDQAQLDSVYTLQDRLVETINESHPAFFDSLQTAVYSRAPESIHYSIMKAAQYTNEALQLQPEYQAKRDAMERARETIMGADYHQFTNEDGSFNRDAFERYARETMNLGGGAGSVDNLLCVFFGVVFVAYWGVFVFGGIAIFGYIAVAGAVGYYLAAAYATYAYVPAVASPSEGHNLQQEMIISEIINNIAGGSE